MRDWDIANVRGLFYEEDRALGTWEVDVWRRLAEAAHGRLWQLFEAFRIGRFSGATRIFTDDAEPHEETERNREFLRGLGYERVTGTHRIFQKEVVRPRRTITASWIRRCRSDGQSSITLLWFRVTYPPTSNAGTKSPASS
jgi:hypothetical protein